MKNKNNIDLGEDKILVGKSITPKYNLAPNKVGFTHAYANEVLTHTNQDTPALCYLRKRGCSVIKSSGDELFRIMNSSEHVQKLFSEDPERLSIRLYHLDYKVTIRQVPVILSLINVTAGLAQTFNASALSDVSNEVTQTCVITPTDNYIWLTREEYTEHLISMSKRKFSVLSQIFPTEIYNNITCLKLPLIYNGDSFVKFSNEHPN